ncbi:MAG TPA: penicillin-binding transpeptidase domain-containing protein, partial [Candidatus Dojkabacteria bacterium]
MNISLKTKKRIKIENFENESDRTIHLTRGRVFFFYIILIAAFMMLSYQLFSMQIVRGSDYLAAANQNYKSRSIIRAPRGNIYDIDGIKLASNIQVYSVYVDPFEFDFDQDGSQLADTLDMDPAEIEYKLRNDNVYGRVTIKNDIGHNDYLSAVKDLEKIKGVYSNAETGRIYIDDYIYSHIIGYIGDASKEDINGKVDPLSRIGKTGLEKFYDDELRGSDGIQIKELEYKSGEVERYVPTNPLPGNNIYLNIDSDWQKIAYDALDKRVRWSGGLGGAVTIMDVETGEIKVMASNPTFSLSEFSGGVSAESFSEILNNPSTPLLDRTIGVALPTGSIFKIISGSIGLQENVITDQTIYNSPGCITLPGDISFCESKDRVLGNLNIYRAIALSSNVYFCEMALDLEYTKGGIDTFKSYTDIFGIGRK